MCLCMYVCMYACVSFKVSSRCSKVPTHLDGGGGVAGGRAGSLSLVLRPECLRYHRCCLLPLQHPIPLPLFLCLLPSYPLLFPFLSLLSVSRHFFFNSDCPSPLISFSLFCLCFSLVPSSICLFLLSPTRSVSVYLNLLLTLSFHRIPPFSRFLQLTRYSLSRFIFPLSSLCCSHSHSNTSPNLYLYPAFLGGFQ